MNWLDKYVKTSNKIPLTEQQAMENSEWLFKVSYDIAIKSLHRKTEPFTSMTMLGFLKAKSQQKGCIMYLDYLCREHEVPLDFHNELGCLLID